MWGQMILDKMVLDLTRVGRFMAFVRGQIILDVAW